MVAAWAAAELVVDRMEAVARVEVAMAVAGEAAAAAATTAAVTAVVGVGVGVKAAEMKAVVVQAEVPRAAGVMEGAMRAGDGLGAVGKAVAVRRCILRRGSCGQSCSIRRWRSVH